MIKKNCGKREYFHREAHYACTVFKVSKAERSEKRASKLHHLNSEREGEREIKPVKKLCVKDFAF